MLKNKKFARYAIAFNLLGIVFNFMYSGLQNDQINIIQAFSAWNNNATLLPLTVGNLVCIVLTFIYGTLFIKVGIKKTLIPCIGLSALGCLGIAAANGVASVNGAVINSVAPGAAGIAGNYALYAVSLFVIRCTCMCFQLSGFMLAANWFIKNRGKVMGIITLGSPLFSVIGTSMMSSFIAKQLGGDYRPFYVGICVVLIVIAVLVAVLLKDTPEQAGLYPDGAATPPKSEETVEDDFIFGSVCNSTSLAGLVKLDPNRVRMDDGVFELVLLRMPRTLLDLTNLLVALNQMQYDDPGIFFRHASRVTVETADDIPWSLDGEYAPSSPVVNIENCHGAVRLLVKKTEGTE